MIYMSINNFFAFYISWGFKELAFLFTINKFLLDYYTVFEYCIMCNLFFIIFCSEQMCH